MEDITIWLGAFITLCMFSFLYRDNPFFRFAEHLFVGVSAGYILITIYMHQVLKPNLLAKLFPATFAEGLAKEAKPELLLIIPAIMGILMLSRLIPRISWMSRYTLSFVVGVTSGLAIVTLTKEYLIPQIRKAIVPLVIPGDWFLSFSHCVLVLGTISCLFYFFFSSEHKSPFSGGLSKIGTVYLMICFGAVFAATIMSRISMVIGRFQFLLQDFGNSVRGNIPGFAGFLLVIGLCVAGLSALERKKHPENPIATDEHR